MTTAAERHWTIQMEKGVSRLAEIFRRFKNLREKRKLHGRKQAKHKRSIFSGAQMPDNNASPTC